MEGMTLERLQVIIDAQTRPFQEELRRVQSQTRQTADTVSRQTSRISSAFNKIGKVVAIALSVTALVSFGSSCLELGSNLNEVQNIVDVTFTSMNESVNSFAKNSITQFGLSETAAKKYVGMYGTMAKQFGFTEQAAYDMSTGLAGMAGDVSSFYNMTADEAYTKLKSVFSGETETLKDIGVVMTQNALDAYALANGFGKTTSQMSEQEKVALRYQFVMKQLSAANGDFTRTSGSWANQTRVLSLQFQSFKAAIGQGLINVFTPIIKVINTVMAKLVALANTFKIFTALITGTKSTGSTASLASDLTSAADSSSSIADSAVDTADATKRTQNALMGFDEVNSVGDTSTDTGRGTTGTDVGGLNTGSIGDIDTANESASKLNDTFNKVKDVLSTLFQPFKDSWATYGQPIIDNFKSGFDKIGSIGSGILSTIYANWGTTVGPLSNLFFSFVTTVSLAFNTVATILKSVWDNGGNYLFEKLLNFVGAVANLAVQINDTFVNPLLTWFKDNIAPVIGEAMGSVLLAVGKVFDVLTKFINYIAGNKTALTIFTGTVVALGLAWKTIELFSFIQQLGGLGVVIKNAILGLKALTLGKIADKVETIALNVLYAKDFVVSLAKGTAGLALQAVQWVKTTAMKAADTIATIAGTVATTAATVATWAFNAALAVLTSPITLVIIAIVALIAGVVLLIKNWDAVKEKTTEVWEKVKNTVKVAVDKIIEIVDSVIEFVKNNWAELLLLIVNPFAGAFALLYKHCESFRTFVNTFASQILGFFSGLWNGIVTVFSDVGNWFIAKFTSAKDGILNAWSNLVTWFLNVWNSLINVFASADIWFKDKFNSAWELIKSIFSISNISTWFTARWSDIKNVFSTVDSWFKEKFNNALSRIKEIFSLSNISTWFTARWSDIKNIYNTVDTWFKDKFNSAWEFIKSIFSLSNLTNWFKERYSNVTSAFDSADSWFDSKFGDAWKKIKGVFSQSSLTGWFGDRWSDIKGRFTDGNNAVDSWFSSKFGDAWEAIKKVFSTSTLKSFFGDNGVWGTIKGLFTDIGSKAGDAVGGAFKSVINSCLSTIEKTINKAIGFINGAINTINKLPGVSIGNVDPITLPRLAKGGVVDSATIAMIGEAGKEAVVPLENNTGWMDKIGNLIGNIVSTNLSMQLATAGESSSSTPIYVTVELDKRTLATAIADVSARNGINFKE